MIIMHTLFHVSPRENFDSIAEVGISPAFSRGRKQCVWLVEWEMLPWGLAHISERHGVAVTNLLVFTVAAPAPELRRTAWDGVLQSLVALYPTQFEYASDALKRFEQEHRVRVKTSKLHV